MGQGPNITPEITNLIATIYLKNRATGPTEARKELLKKMKEKGLDKYFGPNYPSVSTVSVYLKKFRKTYGERPPESTELDKPWTFSALAEHPIAPEAIPLVASIYEKCLLEDTVEWQISIREALWIGRLHKIVELYHSRHVLPLSDPQQEALRLKLGHRPEGYQQIKLEDLVLDWAYTYSQYEILSEIEGKPFYSSELDGYMMGNVYEFYGERRNDFIEQLAEFYGADKDKLLALNLPIGKIERVAASSGTTEFRIFLVPKAEMDEIFGDDKKNLEVVGIQNGLVITALKKDAPDRVFRKLAKYPIYYSSKEVKDNERPYSKEIQE